MEIEYRFKKCSHCGHEGFQWGITIDKEYFICDNCLIEFVQKIEDKKNNAKKKVEWKSNIKITMGIREILQRKTRRSRV